MLSRVVKCLAIVGGVAWFAMFAGAVPQPGSAPQTIVEQLPQLDAIRGLADPEALVFNAAGTKGYIVHVGRDDNAFVTELTVPNTKGGTCELGILKGPRGSPAVAYDEANARLWVGNFPEGNVSIVDVSQPLKEKCVVPVTININDSPNEIVYDPTHKQAYVSGLMTNSIFVLDASGIKARLDLSEQCRGPSSMAIRGTSLYVACLYTHNVILVDVTHSSVVMATSDYPWQKTLATPLAILLSRWKLHVVTPGSDEVVVLDTSTLWELARVKVQGIQTVAPNSRYIALSPEGRFVYVSNAADQGASVLCWYTDKLLETFRVIAETRITQAGVLKALDYKDQHLLYVADKGGILQVFVMNPIYSKSACP